MPAPAAADSVTVRDRAGDLVITLDDLKKFHGQDFFNGLAMALKIMQIATATLGGGRPFDRRKLRLVLGLSPPGVLDGFEYITRAISDRRVIIDPEAGPGVESANGRYYFEIHYEGRKVAVTLKDGIVPAGYTEFARRGFLGLLNPDETKTWSAGKARIAEAVMTRPADQVFDVSPIRPA
jgi:hypothetical protein